MPEDEGTEQPLTRRVASGRKMYRQEGSAAQGIKDTVRAARDTSGPGGEEEMWDRGAKGVLTRTEA